MHRLGNYFSDTGYQDISQLRESDDYHYHISFGNRTKRGQPLQNAKLSNSKGKTTNIKNKNQQQKQNKKATTHYKKA